MSIMKITKIQRQKKDETRFSVYIDDKFACGVSERDLETYCLHEGNTITKNMYDSIMCDLALKRADFLALRYLSYKDRTEKEVHDKLSSYGEFNEDTIEEVIDNLKKRGIINDKRYAEMFVSSKSNNKLDGMHKIKYMLAQKGIKYENNGDDTEFDELSNAIKLLERKTRNIDEIDEKDKKRIFNYMARKGYSYMVIKNAFNELFENNIKESHE